MIPRLLRILLLGAVAGLSGCGAVAWLVAQFAPPVNVPAVYKPPEGKTILVFADDLLSEVSFEPAKSRLTQRLNQLLVEHEVAAKTVSYDRLLDLITVTPDFNKLSVMEVGQKLGADIVLYVRVDDFSLKDNEVSPLWHGRLAATVRMVDTRAKDPSEVRLWPKDRPEGHAMEPIDLPPVDETSPTYGNILTGTLADQMADNIVKLFYDHKEPRQIDSN